MSNRIDVPVLFAWRHSERGGIQGGHVVAWQVLRCPWCDTRLTEVNHGRERLWAQNDEERCHFCGWSHSFRMNHNDENGAPGDEFQFWKELQQFTISDQRLTLAELGTHLRRRFSDVYALSPRRFEELIEDVFRNSGFRTRLTATSRDDGVDIYLLDKDGDQSTIIEVKRYAQQRKVGLAVVDRLIGVQLRKGIHKAMLVTSSDFTEPARGAAHRLAEQSRFSLELIDASRLLSLLGVYNEMLPPMTDVIRAWESAV